MFSHGYKTRPAGLGELELIRFKPRGRQAVIPMNVTAIGENAFADCAHLQSVRIHRNVHTIGANAFKNCTELSLVEFEQGRELPLRIGNYAFINCAALNEISFEGVTANLPYGLFYGCERLSLVRLPDVIPDVGTPKNDALDGVFSGCTSLAALETPEDMLIGPAYLSARHQRNMPVYTLLQGLTCVEPHAFDGCIKLTALHMPDSVRQIGAQAFRGCTQLKSINLPDRLALPADAFDDCDPLFLQEQIQPHVLRVWQRERSYDAFLFLLRMGSPGLYRQYVDQLFKHPDLLYYSDYIVGRFGVTLTHIDCLKRILSVCDHIAPDSDGKPALDGSHSRRAVQTLIALGDPAAQYFLHCAMRLAPVYVQVDSELTSEQEPRMLQYDYHQEKEHIRAFFERLGNPEPDPAVFTQE